MTTWIRTIPLAALLAVATAGCSGCNNGDGGTGTDGSGTGPIAARQKIDPNTLVYPTEKESKALADQWNRFLAGAKSTSKITAAKDFWTYSVPGKGSVEITFGESRPEYGSFDPQLFPGTQPNKFYETRVIKLTAQEDYGTHTERRQYELKFLCPNPGADWQFVGGSYLVDGKPGMMPLSPNTFQGTFLKILFNVDTKPIKGKIKPN